ncbi:hypothetical protein Pcinc_041114 [Petrolisthes cinctipes]|uniref:Group XIIA secretory phospholipase A2 n=1 Tax=Petrolisthes cinctipes TaxID=88211 RepID=A0AAE1BKS5_PETCI|nr:hypothetical protein Pcinc_041114 [Petrolisthes cinctipes]
MRIYYCQYKPVGNYNTRNTNQLLNGKYDLKVPEDIKDTALELERAVMKIAGILFLLTALLSSQGLCTESYFDLLYDNIIHAQETLKDVASSMNKGIKTVAQTVKFVQDFVDSTVEEDCVYSCPKKKIPIGKPNYVPKSNGCGSFGVIFEKENLPRPDMVDCCNEHDLCYGTCGSDKEDCDRKFKRCLYRTCDEVKKQVEILSHKTCQGGAKLLYTTTVALGCTSYKVAQHEACQCVTAGSMAGVKNEL